MKFMTHESHDHKMRCSSGFDLRLFSQLPILVPLQAELVVQVHRPETSARRAGRHGGAGGALHDADLLAPLHVAVVGL